MITLEWKDIGAILAAVTLLGGLAIGFLRFKLSGDFAKSGDIARLESRLQLVEARIAAMPSHEDIRSLSIRVAEVERGLGVVGEAVRGTNEVIRRVEHMVDLLVRHHIGKPEE